MATIVKRTSNKGGKQSTHYQVKVRRKGINLSATFARKSTAEEWALEKERAIDSGRHTADAEAASNTLRDVSRLYLDSSGHKKLKDARNLATRINWWLDESGLGDTTLNKVTPAAIVKAKGLLAKRTNRYGDPISGSAINRYLDALGSVLTYARKGLHIIKENPVHLVLKEKENNGRTRFLTPDEIAALLDACRQSKNKHLELIVLMAIYTGGRQSELLGLRWKDIDIKRHQLTFQNTKNGSDRTVGITKNVLELLRSYPHHLKSDFVFYAKNDPTKPIVIQHAWETARKRAGMMDLRFHDLRHTSASQLAMSGASLHDIAAILGHRTLDMVQRYAHLTTDHTQSALDRMADHVASQTES